jgi:DNA-binding NtrC family response regulator
MDGLSWLAELRKRDPKVKFLVIAGRSEAELRSDLKRAHLDLGTYMFRAMPFSIEEWYLTIQRAFGLEKSGYLKRRQ